MNDVIKQIEKFQTDRLLDKQKYDWFNEVTNILEELLEAKGYEVQDRETLKNHVRNLPNAFVGSCIGFKKDPSKEDIVDAYADIIVFEIGAIMKLGYDPTCVLDEVQKEINSRVGSIVNGKFQKDTSEEAKAKWYKADYSKCLKG